MGCNHLQYTMDLEGREVKVLGMWASPITLRVEWALKLKGLEYEYVSEDLSQKSEELLRLNPIHKKVPVLVHGGRAVAESLVIVEYIDEKWSGGGYHKLLPEEPYERAMARFWASFVEDKIMPSLRAIYRKIDEVHNNDVEDIRENLRILGGALNGKKFFGGESIGYVDVAAGSIAFFLQMIKEVAGVTVIEGMPEIEEWAENFLSVEVIKGTLPPWNDLYELNRRRREQLLAAKPRD